MAHAAVTSVSLEAKCLDQRLAVYVKSVGPVMPQLKVSGRTHPVLG